MAVDGDDAQVDAGEQGVARAGEGELGAVTAHREFLVEPRHFLASLEVVEDDVVALAAGERGAGG